jgi:hypothetical protein
MTKTANKRPTRPHLWISGPDPLRHDQYYAWLKHKSQAAYRKEAHELTFEQWLAIWTVDDRWNQRGNYSNSIVLTRRDKTQPWSVSNCYVKNRQEHRSESATATQTGMTYKPRLNPKPPKEPKKRLIKIIYR